jgi:hypothetical protein
MKTDRPHDNTSARMDSAEPPRRQPFTPAEPAALDTPPLEWGVEYRFAGESDTRTHLHIPDPPSREAARAHAAKLDAEGGYDLVAVVCLPYDTK